MNLNLCRKVPVFRWLFSSKHLLAMKLAVVLIVIGCLQVSAKGFSQIISLSEKNSTLNNLFESIKKQSGYTFFYNNKLIKQEGRISIELNNVSLEAALDQIFKNRPFSYKIMNNTVVIKKESSMLAKTMSSPAVQINIKGKILDRDGSPLSGASVMIKGTTRGTSANASGDFSIDAKEGDILVIKYLGYMTKEILVKAGTTSLDIVLEAELQDLSEVVVTALGVKRSEKALGYAVQKIGGKELQTVKGVDLGTSLTGRVSGLVVKNSTEFNARPTIELRGEGALLVVDGIPYGNLNLRDIPTDDIESIDLLKGSTASALYGSRAKGGVLMITTKKGAAGNGFSVDINSNTMFQLGYLAIPEVQSSYGRGQNGQIDNDYVWGPKLDEGNTARDWNPETKQFEDGRPLVSIGKDNLKNFMNTGIVTNNNIALAQSTENGSFRIGLNHIFQKGQFPNQKLNMMNLTSGGEIKVNDHFKVEGRFGISRGATPQMWGSGYDNQGYLYQMVMWTGTEYDIRDYKDYWIVPNKTQNWMYTNWYDNPYLIAHEKLNGEIRNKVNGNVTANYKFNNDFNLMLRLGYDNYNNKTTKQNPTANIFSTRGGWNARGMYETNDQTGFSTNDDLILTYNKKVSKWSFEGLAGGTLYYYKDDGFRATTKNGLISPRYFSLKGSVEPVTITPGTNWSQQINSLYARTSVSWNDAVFFDATGRNDWNSAQPESSRSFFYPSLGSSVVISELVKLPAVVNMFKLRGSWTLFKNAFDPYAINKTFSTTTSAWNTLNSANYPSKLIGESLLPSTQRTWEIGAAAYLFNKRLHLDLAYFDKYYYNRQVNIDIPGSSGFATILGNIDETYARRGVEITVDAAVIKTSDFEWNSIVNWSNQHRYYVKIDPERSADNPWVKKGQRLDTYLSSYWLRDPSGNVIYNNGFPVESDYNKKYGYGEPDFSIGFINNFRYKNWNLGVNIDGRIGGLMYNYMYDKMWDTGTNPESDNQYRYDQVVNGLNNYVGKGVKVVSGEVKFDKYGNITSDTRQYAPNDVQVGYQDFAQTFRGGDMGIQKETFIKLREVSLGYSFPAKLASRLGAKSASFSLTGQNLLLLTNFKFSDPDIDTENLNSPSSRMIGFNLKVGF
ncbi:SusC/RagA family TonB-linked outer membrane protein [Pedobacter frigoris]|uniref:SusC/RagA family TonB-linked outer membrane protein n=1 Tax=Pedobacter frigoris TaxID=2571272 RepID=A0A4U1CHZ2_9SPHI|nr:SusC/RagA family TonB-linked outer membrane protein [Pedobacter frigoris]TKC06993.1 SusC/RagA family TonB-linked outer membrane protein [Pedobacter frigoris]